MDPTAEHVNTHPDTIDQLEPAEIAGSGRAAIVCRPRSAWCYRVPGARKYMRCQIADFMIFGEAPEWASRRSALSGTASRDSSRCPRPKRPPAVRRHRRQQAAVRPGLAARRGEARAGSRRGSCARARTVRQYVEETWLQGRQDAAGAGQAADHHRTITPAQFAELYQTLPDAETQVLAETAIESGLRCGSNAAWPSAK
jgi:hypothetical protein